MAHVNLKMLAEYTGLSVTTVSRALKDGDDVKQPTKDKVKAAAKKLGYVPNIQGLSLRTGINYNICAILPMIKPGDFIGDVGSLALISGLTAGLENTPYKLTVLPMISGQDPLDPVKLAVEGNLAGGIIMSLTKTNDERVIYLKENNIPFVTFGQTELSINHSFVDVDNKDLGYRAAKYLYEKGCSKIKMISSSTIYTYVWHKYYGVKHASMEFSKNFSMDEDLIIDTDVPNYRDYAKELCSSKDAPDGIICGSEISALGIIAGAQDAGRVIGKDFHVICIETSELPNFFMPPIPGLRQDFHSVGVKLSKYIVKQIEGEAPENLQYIEKATFFPRNL